MAAGRLRDHARRLGCGLPARSALVDPRSVARPKRLRAIERGKDPIVLMELSFKNLISQGTLRPDDFIARADMLAALGYRVLISDYSEFYRLASYMRRYTSEMLPIIGPAPRHRGLWLDFGHHHLGFTLGPVSGRLLASLNWFWSWLFSNVDVVLCFLFSANAAALLSPAHGIRHGV